MCSRYPAEIVILRPLSLLLNRFFGLIFISGLHGCDLAPLEYRCESGRTVEAAYGSDETAVVRYEGNARQMSLAVSASGARYVGGGLEW